MTAYRNKRELPIAVSFACEDLDAARAREQEGEDTTIDNKTYDRIDRIARHFAKDEIRALTDWWSTTLKEQDERIRLLEDKTLDITGGLHNAIDRVERRLDDAETNAAQVDRNKHAHESLEAKVAALEQRVAPPIEDGTRATPTTVPHAAGKGIDALRSRPDRSGSSATPTAEDRANLIWSGPLTYHKSLKVCKAFLNTYAPLCELFIVHCYLPM